MKKTRLLLLMAFVITIGLGAAEKDATLEGTLVDSKCYLADNSLTGNDHGAMKNCGTICLKGGSPGGLLTKDKKFYAIIAPATALADHVGHTVRVTGSTAYDLFARVAVPAEPLVHILKGSA